MKPDSRIPSDPEVLNHVLKCLAKYKPMSSPNLAMKAQLPVHTTLRALQILEETRHVSRTGKGRQRAWTTDFSFEKEVVQGEISSDIPKLWSDWMGYTNIKPTGGVVITGVLNQKE